MLISLWFLYLYKVLIDFRPSLNLPQVFESLIDLTTAYFQFFIVNFLIMQSTYEIYYTL